MTTTLVYVGDDAAYNMRKPRKITFPKGVPITIADVFLGSIPPGIFEVYDPGKHVTPENIKPIKIASNIGISI